jgi:hypothetical protein
MDPAKRISAAVVALLTAGALTACSESTPYSAASPGPSSSSTCSLRTKPSVHGSSQADDAAALAALRSIPVPGAGQVPQYHRAAFGPTWADGDKSRCDTRNDVLARDLVEITRTADCRVLSGVLHDPYTGTIIAFISGPKSSIVVQTDHRVALSTAWKNGAWA